MRAAVIGIDPGKTSGVACVIPYQDGTRHLLTTRRVTIPPGVLGFDIVHAAVQGLQAQVQASGLGFSEVLVVVENQHLQFASAAISVAVVRRLWEVYLYQCFHVEARLVHPSEWRSSYGLNVRGTDVKKAARQKLEEILSGPNSRVLEAGASRKRGEDECEAALMALSFCEV